MSDLLDHLLKAVIRQSLAVLATVQFGEQAVMVQDVKRVLVLAEQVKRVLANTVNDSNERIKLVASCIFSEHRTH